MGISEFHAQELWSVLIIRSFDREPTSQSVVFSEALHKSNVRITENINMVIKNRIKGYN